MMPLPPVIDNKTGFVINTKSKFLRYPFANKIFNPDWVGKRIFYENLKKEDDVIGLKSFIEKLEILINNKELRERFGRNGKNRLLEGDLSTSFRNKKLYNLFK